MNFVATCEGLVINKTIYFANKINFIFQVKFHVYFRSFYISNSMSTFIQKLKFYAPSKSTFVLCVFQL